MVGAFAGTGNAASTGAAGRASSAPPLPLGVRPSARGIPTDAELEAKGAVIGKVLFDNQNIFNLADPEDDTEDPRKTSPKYS